MIKNACAVGVVVGLLSGCGFLLSGCGFLKGKLDEATKTSPATTVVPTTPTGTAPVAVPSGNTPSARAAMRFVAWKPVPAFLSAPVVAGQVISHTEAIVLTKDNHVGLTVDAGATWNFVRLATGVVRAVAGKTGGPYVAAGDGGYLSQSADGKSWTDVPRYTDQVLFAAAVGSGGIAAIGQKGAFVKVAAGVAAVGTLPSGFKPTSLLVNGAAFVAAAGAAGHQSSDGIAWTPVELPAASSGTTTNRGVCALGKVGKKKGVVCSVSGVAYGLSQLEVAVVGKSYVFLTRDGGSTWSVAATPLPGIAGVVSNGGNYHFYDSKAAIVSSRDGQAWAPSADPSVISGAPAWPKPAACEGRLPGPAETCQLTRTVTSPAGLPDVRAFKFTGFDGIAYGDAGLVAMTTDGGATWKSTTGYSIGTIAALEVEGQTIVAAGATRVVVSLDGGTTFRVVELPPKTTGINAARIARNGVVYLAGKGGLILQSQANVTSWVKLATGEKNKTTYVALHEVGTALYAAGAAGELHRSDDAGRTWTSVATGIKDPIRQMAGEGNTVLAVAIPLRYGSNRLLHSDDSGNHFFVQRELSDTGALTDFTYAGGLIRYANLQSRDFGATWTIAVKNYSTGSVDIQDGSGIRIGTSANYYAKDRFYVFGPQEDDITIVDSFYGENARYKCTASIGCWMVSGATLYRPM